jgi:very-short-patch-repair endonuclease
VGWIAKEVRRYGRGREGAHRLLPLIEASGGIPESALETLAQLLFQATGLHFIRPFLACDAEGNYVIELDFAVPELRLGIHTDGYHVHTRPREFQGDRETDRILAGCGWTIVRLTWRDVEERPDEAVAQIQRVVDTCRSRERLLIA